MTRYAWIEQPSRLVLRKTRPRQGWMAAAYASLALVLWGALAFVYVRGRADFDALTRTLFPLTFIAPLGFVPPAWRAWRALRGLDQWQFDRGSASVYRDDAHVAALAAVENVELHQRPGNDADTFVLRLRGRDGRLWVLDESIDEAALDAAGARIAAYLERPFERT